MPVLTETKNQRILIVDDEPAFVSALAESIAEYGYEPIGAVGGREALRVLEEKAVHLIVLDLRMPGMDGFDFLENIRQNPSTQSIPVIVASAVSDTESIFQAKTLGSNDYFIKPFEVSELVARIRRCL